MCGLALVARGGPVDGGADERVAELDGAVHPHEATALGLRQARPVEAELLRGVLDGGQVADLVGCGEQQHAPGAVG